MEATILKAKKIMLASAVTAIIALIVLLNIQNTGADWAGAASNTLGAILFLSIVGFRAAFGQMNDCRKMRSN